jgi:hypothetical protein
MGVDKFNALPRRRHRPQQRPERAPVNHAEANVLVRLESQRINIVPPNGLSSGWH